MILVDLEKCKTVFDVEEQIARTFGFGSNLPLTLAPDGFVVLSNESSRVFENGDVVYVSSREQPEPQGACTKRSCGRHVQELRHARTALQKNPRKPSQTRTRQLHDTLSKASSWVSSAASKGKDTPRKLMSPSAEEKEYMQKGTNIYIDGNVRFAAQELPMPNPMTTNNHGESNVIADKPVQLQEQEIISGDAFIKAVVESKEHVLFSSPKQSEVLSEWLATAVDNLVQRHNSSLLVQSSPDNV